MKHLLQLTLERGASDLHLAVGRPPILRVTGQLNPVSEIPLSSADMRMLLHSIMSSRQRTQYELEREVDFSLALGDGRRFRVNAYFQKGRMAAALRAIPARIPDAESLRIPRRRHGSGRQAPRPAAGRRPHRLRQVHHHGLPARPHQPQPVLPHHHHRRPHRVHPPQRPRHRRPARGVRRHALLRRRAQVHPPPGSRRRPRRRDARPGDHLQRPDRRRDRTPRHGHPAHQRRRPEHRSRHRRLPPPTSRTRSAPSSPPASSPSSASASSPAPTRRAASPRSRS